MICPRHYSIITFQTDIISHYKDETGDIPDAKKFDVVYDAATGSGAGEDYKNKDLSDTI